MKKKSIWLVVSCLMVAVLLLVSCAPAATEEEEASPVEGEEARNEIINIQSAVIAMMVDNELRELLNPVTLATNDMSAFPDTSVCGVDKIYDPDGKEYVRGQDKDGYILYGHDKLADGGVPTLVSYLATRYTEGTYTVDSSGTVTQVTPTEREVVTREEEEEVVVTGEEAQTQTSGVVQYQPLWSYETGDTVWNVAISADGSYIAANSSHNKVYFFSKDSGTPLWSYWIGTEYERPSDVAISSDGSYIAVGSEDQYVHLFSKDSGTPLWSCLTRSEVSSVAISSDGSYIAACSADSEGEAVFLFSKDSGIPLWRHWMRWSGWFSDVDISSDGSYIVAGESADENSHVDFFSRASGTPLWSNKTDGVVLSVAISSDANYIVAGGARYAFEGLGGWVHLFSKDSGTPLWSYWTQEEICGVAISSDGSYIVAGGFDGLFLFSRTSNTPLWISEIGAVSGDGVAISSDGSLICASTYTEGIYFLSPASSTPLCRFSGEGDVAISSDGSYVAFGGTDWNVHLINRTTP